MKRRMNLPLKTRIVIKIISFHIFLIRLVAGWNRPMVLNWKFPSGVGLEIRKENQRGYIVNCLFRDTREVQYKTVNLETGECVFP